ncbi:MAG: hypothetical protein EPGJADBJ_02077 [Saprospiraceae bacterium]|nr:hypothetical protein [Saprospiraceae bacterium]
MLDTLYKFGKHMSNDSSRQEFDDFITIPPLDEKEKSRQLQFLVAEVIFDLDAGSFYLNDRPVVFDDSDKSAKWSPYNLRCLKIQGGNNKSIYPTVDPRKSFDPWKKTFFGKEDKNGNPPKKAELVEAIEKDFPDLAGSPVCWAVTEVFKMRNAFESTFPEWKKVTEALDWGEKSRVVLLFASVKSAELDCPEPKPVAQLEGYDEFLRQKFLQKGSETNSEGEKNIFISKVCYVTGEQRMDVGEPSFGSRYSLNKMFVTTTKNYASGFDDKDFFKNYQAGTEIQTYLERGSKYVLDNLTVKIAGIDHCVIPQFRAGQPVDLEDQSTRLKGKSELLFAMHKKESFGGLIYDIKNIADGETYWITFLGYESDGNFFKTINLIKDISKTHFETVIRVLRDVDSEMAELAGQQWLDTMTYGKEKTPYDFNFYTIYSLIPVRKEKEKRNAALAIFKAILERRPIASEALFGHFVELIQCHRFERYTGYNILQNNNFDFATRDAVFQYHAFLHFLKKIKLLAMDEKLKPSVATLEEKNAAISAFFERMGYTDDQRALFYLGRILNSVGRAQADKEHKSKPVLNKLNYNGMDSHDIRRLRKDLFEKCRQYTTPQKNVLGFNEMNFSKFTDLFIDSKDAPWDKRMKPDEALFYLLSGYSFRAPEEVKDDSETLTTETEN